MRHDRDQILADVRDRFSQRGRIPGRIYRAELRELALRALDAGHLPVAVAKAAGVSPQSIHNWRRSVAKSSVPVELKVVEELAPKQGVDRTLDAWGRLHFRSGAMLELPLAFIDLRLFALLNGGAS